MTEQDVPAADLTDYEWELDAEHPERVYAKWMEGPLVFRSFVAQFSDPYLANLAVVAQHYRLEQAAERPKTLSQDLAAVLNRHSMENASNTPDFLLAEYMERCLAAAEILVNRRDEWYGVRLQPGVRLIPAPDPDDGVVEAEIVDDVL